MWLTAPIIEKDEQGRTSKTRPDRGTPQGGVISPLLSNLYLHWFDRAFHGTDGPFKFANARLIRFADDFVIMARYVDERIIKWVKEKIEMWMGLAINRDKTNVINAKESGSTLDFLGYSFRYDKPWQPGASQKRYWNRIPSKKSVKRFNAAVHEITSKRCMPVSEVVERLNRYLVGWSNYFGTGYPSKTFGSSNAHVQKRMMQFLCRLSQRRFKPPEGMSWYKFIYEKLKVHRLKAKTRVQALR